MVNFKITKKEKILEVNNDMCHNYYYLIHGRIYNDGKTKYKKFKYIVWFDIFDLQEFYDKDVIYKSDIANYVDQLENGYLMAIKSYEDTEHIKEFYEYCNETITNFNKSKG